MDFLFDIGNVIVGVDFIPSLSRISSLHGEKLEQRLSEIISRKDEMESGRLPTKDYFPWVMEKLEVTGCREEFLNAWIDIFSPNEAMWETIRHLSRDNHRLFLFSNINQPHQDYLMEKYPVFNHFDGGTFSHETGHIKPESEIYQIAMSQHALDPAETIYIDDLPANIAGGKQAGIAHCYRYDMNNHDAFLQWLEHEVFTK